MNRQTKTALRSDKLNFIGFTNFELFLSLFPYLITALFNNTRTLKLTAQPTNAFFAAVNQVFDGSSQLTTTSELWVRGLNSAQQFDHRALGSSRKLGGAGEHLIDGSEKRICRLSFEF